MDYASIPVPEACYADFCLIPVSATIKTTTTTNVHLFMPYYSSLHNASALFTEKQTADQVVEQVGTGNISVAEEIAEVQRVLKASGLKYTLHSAGTTVGT